MSRSVPSVVVVGPCEPVVPAATGINRLSIHAIESPAAEDVPPWNWNITVWVPAVRACVWDPDTGPSVSRPLVYEESSSDASLQSLYPSPSQLGTYDQEKPLLPSWQMKYASFGSYAGWDVSQVCWVPPHTPLSQAVPPSLGSSTWTPST